MRLVIALLGAIVLLRPGTGSFQPAALLALTAAAIIGLEITIIKLLSGREAPIQILIVNNTLGAGDRNDCGAVRLAVSNHIAMDRACRHRQR